jgi:MFS family permease
VLASLQRHRNYRLYFAGQFVSQIGTWLQTAAQSWLILELTHSAQAVGVLGFCFYGPYAVLGLLGGALADRWDRRTTLLVGQAAMALCAALLAIVVFTHVASVWLIDAIAVVRGTVLVFNNPSRQALIVQLVGRSELGNAIALNSSLNNATRIIGPALAGVLIDTRMLRAQRD